MSFYWWVIYAYPPFAKNRGIKKEKEEKKREKRKKKKKVKNVGIFHTRSCAPLSSHLPSLLLLPPSPRSYARHYSRRFHADPRCPHGSSTVKHTVDIGETVLAINPEYRQKPGLYGRGGRRKRREGRPHRWNCPRRWEKMEKEDSSRASIDVSFFSLSLSSLLFFYFFCKGDTRFFVAIHSPQIDRGRNFEKWEFWMDVECNGNNAFLFPFFPSFLPSNWKICDSMGYWGMMALNRITIFFFFFFWERNWRLEMKNFSFRNFYFFFRKGETTKNLFIFRLLECVITIRFCGKKFHWNEIKKLDGFLSRMRDISWNFELRILFVPSMLNSPPFLSFWFIFFRRLSTGRRTKTQGAR